MRKIIYPIVSLLFTLQLAAQDVENTGKVIYENTRKISISFGADMAHLSDMIPKQQTSTKELLFSPQASLYRNMEKISEEDVVQESTGGRTMMFRMQQSENIIHTDLMGKVKTELRDFMSRKFLIESPTDTIKWKLTGNSKLILNHSCLEAELVGSEKKTIAWFTPEIPIAAGPEGFSGLPGLILAVDIDNGETTIIAQSVDLIPIDTKLIAKPKGGRKVTQQEYNRIVEEKREEMQQGGGTIIIRR
ncbi:MAG: GLPGLI family protein [Tenuifilaceae bacterium]|jgi:GLPGLI family protein|nr:GLPGLI family protein [Tenuifilaceae bacterium]